MEFDSKVKKILSELGLTELQSRFYLTLLKSGGMSISKLAKLLGINRTNSYNILEKLKSLDLVYEENKQTGKVIFAKSYETLLSALKTEENKIKDYQTSVNELIPFFKSFNSKEIPDSPKVRIFDGTKGLNSIVDDILDNTSKNKEILLFSNQQSAKGVFSKKKHEEFIKTRIQKNIKIKVLSINNDAGHELKSLDSKNLRETKILPQGFSFDSEIYIYENKISMLDVKSQIIGVVIESEELFRVHKQFFEFLWQISI
jgi:sugar-specific transcriptional regulator TrmB